MPHEWRLLFDDIHEAQHHFAMEEALARLIDEGRSPPTLRMRQVYPAVFVGVYQNTRAEVNVDYCKAHNIQIVRRANGGGAVYHEMGSFCTSAFFRRGMFRQSEEELYRLFAVPVTRTCADYGVTAHFQGRNDVLVGERKIYGSAQFAWYDAFVQSGTFLVNIDFEKMERALTPPQLKFVGKPARSVRERVTSLSLETGRKLDAREVMRCFAGHVSGALGIQLVPGELTAEEQTLAAELLDVKYSTDEWNFGHLRDYQVMVAERTEEGVISLSADMEGETIRSMRLSGDMLLSDRQKLKDLEHSLSGFPIQEAQTMIQATSFSMNMQKSLLSLLEKLRQEADGLAMAENKERKE